MGNTLKSMKEYRIWKAMKARCYCKSNENVGNYQRLGIQVCDEWKTDFFRFLRDVGLCPTNDHSIERIDNYGNYCKENCKWIHKSEQSKNRIFNKRFTYKGETKNLKDWARYFGINYTTLYNRIYTHRLSFEDALRKPVIYKGKQVTTIKQYEEG